MNSQDDRRRVQRIKDAYPAGTRIVLLHMADPYAPVPPGTRGTVEFVDDLGDLFPIWDNGRSLGLVPGDSFRKLTEQELAEESQTQATKSVVSLITIDDLRQMADVEGLILQGCGGDPQEWVEGVNSILTQEGILQNGALFQDIRSFQQDGQTNLLFLFGEVSLDIGKLALWRLQTHDVFHGVWLSDFLENTLGIGEEPEESFQDEEDWDMRMQ